MLLLTGPKVSAAGPQNQGLFVSLSATTKKNNSFWLRNSKHGFSQRKDSQDLAQLFKRCLYRKSAKKHFYIERKVAAANPSHLFTYVFPPKGQTSI